MFKFVKRRLKDVRFYHSRHTHWSGAQVRQTFLEFFKNEQHLIVPSSSVIPKYNNRNQLPFVNAGMIKWRPIFQNEIKPPPRFKNGIANSQKCIRVGGKSCDLETVGHDGHHHTFFEMLGNWSFNDSYGRKRSCQMAYDLLTKVYEIPESKLFVTYFDGCGQLGLPPDEETRETWREIGVSADRILPFGAKDNFWQMGLEGPCGPCTEIHYSHTENINAKNLVNANTDQSVVELWNLVFIEHCRSQAGGPLEPLEHHHVDTGMGLERLTTVLNGSKSNYDTDLFSPLFEVIQNHTDAPIYGKSFQSELDTNYRILADHTRMITVCLCDGVLPYASPKLRDVLRKVFRILRQKFMVADMKDCAHITGDLATHVLSTMNYHYSSDDFEEKRSHIHQILQFEAENLALQERRGEKPLKDLEKMLPRGKASKVDVIDAYQVLNSLNYIKKNPKEIQNGVLSAESAFELFKSLGVRKEKLKDICDLSAGIQTYDEEGFDQIMEDLKTKSRTHGDIHMKSVFKTNSSMKNHPSTKDKWKYEYTKVDANRYQFPLVQTKVLEVIQLANDQRAVLLAKTCCYGESGGQAGDRGKISNMDDIEIMEITDTQLDDDDAKNNNHHVWHIGTLKPHRKLEPGTRVKVQFQVDRRIGLMQNHTGTHLLNCVLHQMFPFTRQTSSSVMPNEFKFEFISLNSNLGTDDVIKIEQEVNAYINNGIDIERVELENPDLTMEVDMTLEQQLMEKFPSKLVITLPEENYPEKVSVIELEDSVEPCCGTHVLNTSDIQSFVILSVKSPHPGHKLLTCATGQRAASVRDQGMDLIDEVMEFNNDMDGINLKDKKEAKKFQSKINSLKKKIIKVQNDIPWLVRTELLEILNDFERQLKSGGQSSQTLPFDVDDKNVIVHVCEKKATPKKLFENINSKPFLILIPNKEGDKFIAYANVPEEFEDSHFNAELWLKSILDQSVPINVCADIKNGVNSGAFIVENIDDLKTNAELFARHLA